MDDIEKTVKRLFDTPDGKAVLSWLCKVSGVYQSSYTGDPYMSVYADGMKATVLKIMHLLERDPDFMQEQIRQHHAMNKRKRT